MLFVITLLVVVLHCIVLLYCLHYDVGPWVTFIGGSYLYVLGARALT